MLLKFFIQQTVIIQTSHHIQGHILLVNYQIVEFLLQLFIILQNSNDNKKNYLKIAQQAQKTLIKFAKRTFMNILRNIVLKKRHNEGKRQSNNLSIFPLSQSERSLSISARSYSNKGEPQQTVNDLRLKRTLKNLQIFQLLPHEVQEIQNINYGDYIWIQSYQPHIDTQKARIYSCLDKIQANTQQEIYQSGTNPRKCIFQICNPCPQDTPQNFTKNSLCAFKNIITNKYITVTQTITSDCSFQCQLNHQILSQSIFYLQNQQQSSCQFYQTEQLLYIGLFTNSNLFLSLSQSMDLENQMCCSNLKYGFKMKKVINMNLYTQSPYFTIKNQHYQLYLTVDQLQNSNLFSKKLYSNVFVETGPQNRQKGNSITIEEVQLNKKYQSQVKLKEKCQDLNQLEFIWGIQDGPKTQNSNYHLFNVAGFQGIAIKGQKSIKMSFNCIQFANIQLFCMNNSQYQIICNDSNQLMLIYDKEKEKYQVILHPTTKTEISLQQNRKKVFKLNKINQTYTKIIMQMKQLFLLLKRFHKFLQKWGYCIDKKTQCLVYGVEEMKNKMFIWKLKHQEIQKVLNQLRQFLNNSNNQQFVKNLIKKLKIINILVSLCKLIMNKIDRKDKVDKIQTEESPYVFANHILSPLMLDLLKIINQCILNNKECSTVILNDAVFFNKLMLEHSQPVGVILKQSIKNISIFTNKIVVGSSSNQLFQWGSLIQPVTQKNINLQKIYIDIVAEIVVDPNDKGIIAYQNKCKQMIFLAQSTKNKCIVKFSLEINQPIIVFENNLNMNNFLQNNKTISKLPLIPNKQVAFQIEELYNDQTHNNQVIQLYIQYICSILKFMRNLCKDRNRKLLKVIQERGLTQSHLSYALASNIIGWQMKTQYLSLYIAISIDCDPFLAFNKRQVKCQIWSRIQDYNFQDKTVLLFRQFIDINGIGEKLKQFDNSIIPLIKTFFIHIDNKILNCNLTIIDYKAFEMIMKVIYEAMNYGFLNITAIQIYVFALISRISKILQFTTNPLSQLNQDLIMIVASILELYEQIMVNIQGIEVLKRFIEQFISRNNRKRKENLKVICIDILKNKLDFKNTTSINTNHKKRTTFRIPQIENQRINTLPSEELEDKVNQFLLKILIMEKSQQTKFYSKILHTLHVKNQRYQNISTFLQEIIILNNHREQEIYNHFNGREQTKLLNVIKIQQLVEKIIGLEQEGSDNQEQKRKREKILQLNNLFGRIVRQLQLYYGQSFTLFQKAQQILAKLNVHQILKNLLQYSQNPLYFELISTLHNFYIQFTKENKQNTQIVSKYFQLFFKKFSYPKQSYILAHLFSQLPNKQKSFEEIYKTLEKKSDKRIIQSIFETIYRIIAYCKDDLLVHKLKSSFFNYLVTSNELQRLILPQYLSKYFVGFLCEAAKDSPLLISKLKKVLNYQQILQILESQNQKNYALKTTYLQIYFYFYLNEKQIEQREISHLIKKIIFPQLRHLPSAFHSMTHERFLPALVEDKTATILGFKGFKEKVQLKPKYVEEIKRLYQKIVIYQPQRVQASQQEHFWNFILNSENPKELTLLNFTILIMEKYSGGYCLALKEFINYIDDLYLLLSLIFHYECQDYQKNIVSRVQLIMVIIKEKLGIQDQPIETINCEQYREYAKQFFNSLSEILRQQNISHRKLIGCLRVNETNLIGKRTQMIKTEKLVNEIQFESCLRNILGELSNPTRLQRLLKTTNMTKVFDLFRQKKIRKLNMYNFVEKLIGTLEYLKIIQINNCSLNYTKPSKENQQNMEQRKHFLYHQTQNIGQKQLFSYINQIKNCFFDQLSSYTQDLLCSKFSDFIKSNKKRLIDWSSNPQLNIVKIHKKYLKQPILEGLFLQIIKMINKQGLKIIKPQTYIEFITFEIEKNKGLKLLQILEQVIINARSQYIFIVSQQDSIIKITNFILKSILVDPQTSTQIFQSFMRTIDRIFNGFNPSDKLKNLLGNKFAGTLLQLIQRQQKVPFLYFANVSIQILTFLVKNMCDCKVTAVILSKSNSFNKWIMNMIKLQLPVCCFNTNLYQTIRLQIFSVSLDLLMKFNMKNYIVQVKQILKELSFSEIMPILEQLQRYYKKSNWNKQCNHGVECSKEFCNLGFLTQHDQLKLEMLVKLLILVKLNMDQVEDHNQQYITFLILQFNKNQQNNIKQKQKPAYFFAKMLSVVNINIQGINTNIYFKKSEVQKYNNQSTFSIIQQLIPTIEPLKVFQNIYSLSIVYQNQLQWNKNYSIIPTLLTILDNRKTINNILNCLLIIILSMSLWAQEHVQTLVPFFIILIILKILYFVHDVRIFFNITRNFFYLQSFRQNTNPINPQYTSLILAKAIILAFCIAGLSSIKYFGISLFLDLCIMPQSIKTIKAIFLALKNLIPITIGLVWLILFSSNTLYFINQLNVTEFQIKSVKNIFISLIKQTFQLAIKKDGSSEIIQYPILGNFPLLFFIFKVLLVLVESIFISSILIVYSNHDLNKQSSKDKCIICLKPQNEHIKNIKHDIRNYLSFFIYFRSSKKQESTHLYIKKKIQSEDFLFLKFTD